MHTFLAENEQDGPLLPVSTYTINKYPFFSLLSARFFVCFVFFCIFVLLLVISLFKMAPKPSGEILSHVYKHEKAMIVTMDIFWISFDKIYIHDIHG